MEKRNDMEDGWSSFLKLCRSTKSVGQFEELLNCLLTPEEKEMLSARTRILSELLKGELTQREIAERSQVSIAQITRGSNEVKRISDSLKEFLKAQLK